MEVRGEVESLIHEVDPCALAHCHRQRVVPAECVRASVEDHVPGFFKEKRIIVEERDTGGIRFPDVPLRLGHHPFVVHRGERNLGIDDERSVHAVGDVHRHVAVGAVVHEHARIQQPDLDARRHAGIHGEAGGPAALAGDCVEVDVVRVGVAGEVGQGDVHDIADAAAQHRSGGTTYDLGLSRDAEAPHLGRHSVSGVDRTQSFDDLKGDIPDPLIRSGGSRGSRGGIGDVHLVGRGRRQLSDWGQRWANALIGRVGSGAASAREPLGGDDLAYIGGREVSLLHDDRRCQHRDHRKQQCELPCLVPEAVTHFRFLRVLLLFS